ncbi:hypothetical protein BBW65_05250 [Helicobacter enhydrae]|uniref:Redoxin domain-containing protein n=1 Tax=Helicobacter enhydrae TaxID=222136 RepID=A0A1B1U618_9HELI|nr:hypothetical protein [Helicobacter enhydrae]ANV98237.1 hypothetical protein BBW65_05250 [Helicobacter enhydrae]
MPYLIVLLVFFITGCDFQSAKNHFYFQNTNGDKLKLIQNHNTLELPNNHKPVLLFLIRASCTECFNGIEHTIRIFEEYKDKINFIPIIYDLQNPSIQSTQLREEAITLQKKYNLPFDFYYSTDGKDFLQTFQQKTNTPLLVLYNAKLQKVMEYEGLVPEEMIGFDLNQILENGAN